MFGPVLHVVRFRADRLDEVVDAVNATGYGLTLGVHSRIDETVRRIVERLGSATPTSTSFPSANLRFANLKYADASGASFRDACPVGANFDGANVDGAHFEGAILCGTILANGDIDDSGCALATGCCLPGCINEHDCPSS